MASIVNLQRDLNALLMQKTLAYSEKHLVLSMLCESYTKQLQDIGCGYHMLIGFYQEAVEVLNNHFKEHNLSNLLVDTSNNPINDTLVGESLLQKARSSNGSFLQRWEYLDFEHAISRHLEETIHLEETTLESMQQTKKSNRPSFTRPFFIALKKNLQS